MCTLRFGELNNLFNQWQAEDLPVQLIGVGKDSHMSAFSNWSNGNDSPICADTSPFSVWSDWGASQRDLFILNHEGEVVFNQNIGSGIPSDLESLVMNLINNISDCDSTQVCAEVLTCCDGLLYPTACCSDNCDEPIDDTDNICGEDECIDGEMNNDNTCNPMECIDGEWIEIIIDCAEQMGVPCEGGLYVSPPEGVCCSTCVQYGDSNADGTLNVLDVVQLVNLVIANEYNELVDMNNDGNLNVLDVVQLVNLVVS